MKSQKIRLADFYILDVELNGRTNPETGESLFAGLLAEKISLVAKYWLTQLSTTVKAEVTQLDTQRDELIKKYGETDENGSKLLQFITKTEGGVEINEPNPNFIEFNQEFSKLLNQEKEITYTPVKLSDLANVESTSNFATLFKFVEA